MEDHSDWWAPCCLSHAVSSACHGPIKFNAATAISERKDLPSFVTDEFNEVRVVEAGMVALVVLVALLATSVAWLIALVVVLSSMACVVLLGGGSSLLVMRPLKASRGVCGICAETTKNRLGTK